MIKICHMTSAHKQNDLRILYKECVSLAKKSNYEVYLVARGKSCEYKGVHIIGVGYDNVSRVKRLFVVKKAVFKSALDIDADIYQIHDPELLIYAKELKKRGKTVIFDSHENYQLHIAVKPYIPIIIRPIITRIYGRFDREICKYLDGAIFPSNENPYEGRVRNIACVRNTPMLDEMNYTVRNKVYNNDVAVYVGSLTENRGIVQSVKGCYKANVPLILGGRIIDNKLMDRIKSMPEYSVVNYVGFCDRQQLEKLYSTVTIGLNLLQPVGQYVSISALSTKIYEFMMMGLPFILPKFPFFSEFIDKYPCGICVDPTKPDEIASAIEYLKENHDKAIEMGLLGRKLIETQFNWTIEEKNLYELYDKLIHE